MLRGAFPAVGLNKCLLLACLLPIFVASPRSTLFPLPLAPLEPPRPLTKAINISQISDADSFPPSFPPSLLLLRSVVLMGKQGRGGGRKGQRGKATHTTQRHIRASPWGNGPRNYSRVRKGNNPRLSRLSTRPWNEKKKKQHCTLISIFKAAFLSRRPFEGKAGKEHE